MKEEFFIPSADGKRKVHGFWWIPEGKVRAVVQLVHGMVEHIGRYDAFARYLNQQGFAVIGHDHLGHGESVLGPEDYGFFSEKMGKVALLKDMYHVTRMAKGRYPTLPVFVLGHSMGSFFLRRYLTIYGDKIDGAIIMGTGWEPLGAVRFGRILAKVLMVVRGGHFRSQLVNGLALGSYVGKFGGKRRPGSWLSRNEENVRAYREDAHCQFRFTVSAYHDFFSVLEDLAKKKNFDRIPRNLPVLLVSGMDDALGGFTKKVLRVYNEFVELGMEDVDVRFYKDDRHEILNELDRDAVYEDIRDWLERHLEERAETPAASRSTAKAAGDMAGK